jgi:hypothetical protein
MLSVVGVLSHHTTNPLPSQYTGELHETISLLVEGLKAALKDATTAFVVLPHVMHVPTDTKFYREYSKVSKLKVVTIQRSGKRGRPRKVISEAFLKEAFRPGRNISTSKLGASLPVHHNTLKSYMALYKIKRNPFSIIPDSSLDMIVREYKDLHPNTGIRYVRGFLFGKGLRVERSRIIASLARVDDIAKVVRRHRIIQRREYKSSRPNALWHIDGHHKLGLWGIVIHAVADGYDRVVSHTISDNRV